MFSIRAIGLLFLMISTSSFAGFSAIKSRLDRGQVRFSDYPSIIKTLTRNAHPYSAIPWAKEYLASNATTMNSKFNHALDRLIERVGTKQFETMPARMLSRSNANHINYVLAKKHFRKQKYNLALTKLKKIKADSSIYPFALNMLGSISSIEKDQGAASGYFEDCVDFSKASAKKAKGRNKRQLLANRDYCTLGMARSFYAKKDFKKSSLLYLDIPKSSGVWPQILFEEAWNSYYLGNYNRSLGKLVTYKAPVFAGYFNPEIDVLNALTYFRMCLFDDANKIAENYYKKYLNQAANLRRFLLKRGKNHLYYYKLMARFEDGVERSGSLLFKLLKVISKEEAYQETRHHLLSVSDEFKGLKSQARSRSRRILLRNSIEVLRMQKRLLGSYVRGRLVSLYADMYKSFQNMSYIKLEILAKQKERLYSFDENKSGKRGDLKYLERNEKQYFWNFNGEFWADELGDYVFALKSECK
jgi:hypothetical protein